MAKDKINKEANKIVSEYTSLINYDIVNKELELSNVDKSTFKKISKDTILNISKWALNGASDSDIRDNLDITENQFRLLCEICPVLVAVMQKSREMADIIITGSLVQTAIGGKVIKKQQLMKVGDYDENGCKIGEHVEKFWVEEELPPNPLLLKFIAEHKLSEKFGDKEVDKDSEMNKVIATLDTSSIDKAKALLGDDK